MLRAARLIVVAGHDDRAVIGSRLAIHQPLRIKRLGPATAIRHQLRNITSVGPHQPRKIEHLAKGHPAKIQLETRNHDVVARLQQPPRKREQVLDKLPLVDGHALDALADLFSVAAITGSTVQGSEDQNSTASIFPHPFRFRLSTTPAADFVSALGFSSITYCLAYWRRVSIRRSSSAVLLLRIGPTISSKLRPSHVSPQNLILPNLPKSRQDVKRSQAVENRFQKPCPELSPPKASKARRVWLLIGPNSNCHRPL